MKKYILGVDGGSSKSHLAIFDLEGNLVEFSGWGSLNHESMDAGFSQLENEWNQFFSHALSNAKIESKQIEYAVLGMSGVDTKEQHRVISDMLKQSGLNSFLLCNDAYLGIPAVSPTGAGICAINGSGCSIAGINGKKMLQIGGLGGFTGDMGGGSAIGEQVIRTVYNSLFRKGEPTLMKELLFNEMGIADKYEFVDMLSKHIAKPGFIAHVNRLLFTAEREGDPAANALIAEIALSYANGICAMIDELALTPNDDVCVALAGSVFVKESASAMNTQIENGVQQVYPNHCVTFEVLKKPPVAGAVIWALKRFTGENLIDKVCAQL